MEPNLCAIGNERPRRRWRTWLLTVALAGGAMSCAGLPACYFLHSGGWRAIVATGLFGFLIAVAVGVVQSLYGFVRIAIWDLIQSQSWEQVGTSLERVPFSIEGADVWQHEWRRLICRMRLSSTTTRISLGCRCTRSSAAGNGSCSELTNARMAAGNSSNPGRANRLTTTDNWQLTTDN